MKTSTINWDNLRLGLYGVIGSVLAMLGAMNIITEDQATMLGGGISELVGSLFFVLAMANVGKGRKPVVEIPVTPTEAGNFPFISPSSDPGAGTGPLGSLSQPNFGAIQDLIQDLAKRP